MPWDRIPEDGKNLDDQKEKIFRKMQRETIEDELLTQDRPSHTPSTGDEKTLETSTPAPKIPYSNMELLRQAAFGACLGSITGAVFGFMDGMRTAQENSVLAKASNQAKLKYLMEGTTRSGTLFGAFFGGFQMMKYGLKVSVDPGEVSEICLAGIAGVGTLYSQPRWRPNVPYAIMLVIMDGANLYMRKTS